MGCESGGARTHDLRLKRPLLYQLSYRFAQGLKASSKDNALFN